MTINQNPLLRGTPAIHPFLFAIIPILVDWQANYDQVLTYVVLPPIALSLLLAFGLTTSLTWAFRDVYKGSLVAGILLLVLLYHQQLVDVLTPLVGASLSPWAAILAGLSGIAVLSLVAFRWSQGLTYLTRYLNVLSMLWLASAAFPLIYVGFRALGLRLDYSASHPTPPLATGVEDDHRDVYYIILDSYGRQDELLHDYDFDNSWFLDGLRQMGFTIPECSLGNYAFTALSLASSLNMDYLPELGLAARETEPQVQYATLEAFINSSEVRRRFESMGFRTVAVDNGIRWAQMGGAYHINRSSVAMNIITYGYHLLSKTAFRLLSDPNPDFAGMVKYRRTLEVLRETRAIPTLAERTFAVIHVLAPHSPFVFKENGEYEPEAVGSAIQDPVRYRQQYAAELTYLNRSVLETVASILATSDPSPIIVIQGDHSWSLGGRSQLQILNAYYLPDGGADKLYSQITPVNTFRLILDYYFGEKHGMLEDRSYFSELLKTPYKFEDIAGSCGSLPADRYPSLFSDAVELAPLADWGKVRTWMLGDVNGDRMADLVGVGDVGVLAGLSVGAGIGTPSTWSHEFSTDADWEEAWPIGLADVTGDGKSDLVGFAPGGVAVSLSDGRQFGPQSYWTREFRTEVDWPLSWPRLLGDVNGDGLSDIVGVAPGGVIVSLSDGRGFGAGSYWTRDFRVPAESTSPWAALLGDVNGDGKADFIGLTAQGVVVAFSDGNSFAAGHLWMHYAGAITHWRQPWPLVTTDIDGDGKFDLLGFTPDGAFLAISTGESFLPSARYWIWGAKVAATWPPPETIAHGDINADARSDIVGFDRDRMLVAYGTHQ